MVIRDFKEAQKVTWFYAYKEGHNEVRPKGDFYPTSPQAMNGLLSKEKFGKTILEPCCGNGAISKILEGLEHPLMQFDGEKETQIGVWKHEVISRDLYDWGYGEPGKDFLEEPIIDVDAMITNPPFKLGVEFTLRGLECTKAKKGKVAMFNRLAWLEGVARGKMFQATPLARVWVFSRRLPRFHRFDHEGKTTTSLIAFAWYVFDWTHNGPPLLGWI